MDLTHHLGPLYAGVSIYIHTGQTDHDLALEQKFWATSVRSSASKHHVQSNVGISRISSANARQSVDDEFPASTTADDLAPAAKAHGTPESYLRSRLLG